MVAVRTMSNYEEGILRSLRRITRAIDLYSRQLATRFGLTGPQLVCLRTLARLGPITPSVLAREMDLSHATVTGIVDRLESQGLLARTRDAVDRRRVVIGLTAKGSTLAQSAPSALQDIFSGRLAALTMEEQSAIHHSLERIVEMMGAGKLVPDPALPSSSELLSDAQILSLGPNLEANDAGPNGDEDMPPAPREESVK